MFRIRRVLDDLLPTDRQVTARVQEILREQFPGAPDSDVDELSARLRDPRRSRLRTLLYVAEAGPADVRGFALVLHDARHGFLFLDYIASQRGLTAQGVGGALLERVRDEARAREAIGVFFECAPDERDACADPAELQKNVARLRFYERFGARPIDGTAYRMPLRPGQTGLPFLMFDPLDSAVPLRRAVVRRIVRTILAAKYAAICPPGYIDAVVASFRDDPVKLRPPRYVRAPAVRKVRSQRPPDTRIALVINQEHDIHHVRERGYVEAPVRIPAILSRLEPSGLFEPLEPRRFSDRHLAAVHDADFLAYLERCCASAPADRSVYPYVFPIRNVARPPRELALRAGYYCIDTFTPLNRNAYPAARRAVDCALTAAERLEAGQRLAYALVRPPGHHAERRAFGGFCYLNSTAISAQYLSRHGRVAILDIDYHHGNGQQQIFYERPDVLTQSIHGHPRFAYPYFSGFADERGAGEGAGYNLNHPLPEALDGRGFRAVLRRALREVERFEPLYLVVALGLDTASGDPTGTWRLGAADFAANGRMIGALRLPTLVVQEGGYRTRTLGINALEFFQGLVDGVFT